MASRLQRFLTRLLDPEAPARGPDQEYEQLYASTSGNVSELDFDDPFEVPGRLEAAHDAMAFNDIEGRYSKALDTMSDNLFRAGYLWQHDSEQVADQLNELDAKYDLAQYAKDWVKSEWLHGDLFLNIIAGRTVGGNYELEEFHVLPPLRTQRLSNAKDRFENPDVAYRVHSMQEVDDSTPIDLTRGADTYGSLEVIHVPHNKVYGRRYGRPMLMGSHQALKRLIGGDHNINTRRVLHGSQILHHQLVDPTGLGVSDKDLKTYQKQAASDPKTPTRGYIDLVTRDNVEIKVIEGDAHLSQVGDIIEQAEAYFSSLPIPKALMGYADSINRDIFAIQREQYIGWLEGKSKDIAGAILKPCMDVIMAFNGMNPMEVDPKVEWGSREAFIAKDFQSVATGVMHLRKAEAISQEDAVKLVARELNLDPQELWDRMQAETEERERKDEERARVAAERAALYNNPSTNGNEGDQNAPEYAN